jgi:cytochrome c556
MTHEHMGIPLPKGADRVPSTPEAMFDALNKQLEDLTVVVPGEEPLDAHIAAAEKVRQRIEELKAAHPQIN